MKRIISYFVVLLVFTAKLSAQCPAYPSNWDRHLPGTSYTWAFSIGTLNGGPYGVVKYTNGNPVTSADVEAAIADAVSAWTSAANFAGTRITITPGIFGAANNINVQFGSVAGDFCATTGGLTITLDNEVLYKPNNGSTGVNLATVVLHEMGHVFLGSGHPPDFSDSIMIDDVCNPQAIGLSSCDTQFALDLYNPNYNVIVKNDFNGGDVKVDGATYSDIGSDGEVFNWRESTFPHTVEALDGQSFGGYGRRYQSWTPPSGPPDATNPLSVPKPSSSSVTYRANFKKEYNITFQNNFIGVGNAGVMKVKRPGESQFTQYTLPTSPFLVVQDQSISAEGLNQVYTGMSYTFTNWTKDGAVISTSASTNFTPNDYTIYVANFTGKPTPTLNVSASGPVGTPIVVTWSNHPRGNTIEYHLWQKVKHQLTGTWSGPNELVVLSYGVTCYTDYNYVNTNGYTHDLVQYDVRARYLPEGSDADQNYVTAFGQISAKITASNSDNRAKLEPEIPSGYLLSNYPNPFNPATTIRFDLPQPSFVFLEVFDLRGGLMTTLVREQKPAGIHRVQLDASQWPAGLYLYRLQAGTFVKMQKIALVK